MNKSIEIEKISWVDYKEKIAESKTVIIPLGSVKSHGTECSLGTSTHIAKYFANKIGERSCSLAASIFPYGYCPNGKGYPGAASIDPYVLRKVFVSYAESYIRHGAEYIIFINGDDDTNEVLQLVICDLYDKYGILATYTSWWKVFAQKFGDKNFTGDRESYEKAILNYIGKGTVDNDTKYEIKNISGAIAYKNGWKCNGTSIYFPVDLHEYSEKSDKKNQSKSVDKQLIAEMIESYVNFNDGLIKELKKIK